MLRILRRATNAGPLSALAIVFHEPNVGPLSVDYEGLCREAELEAVLLLWRKKLISQLGNFFWF